MFNKILIYVSILFEDYSHAQGKAKGGPEFTTFGKLSVYEVHGANGYQVQTSPYLENPACPNQWKFCWFPLRLNKLYANEAAL